MVFSRGSGRHLEWVGASARPSCAGSAPTPVLHGGPPGGGRPTLRWAPLSREMGQISALSRFYVFPQGGLGNRGGGWISQGFSGGDGLPWKECPGVEFVEYNELSGIIGWVISGPNLMADGVAHRAFPVGDIRMSVPTSGRHETVTCFTTIALMSVFLKFSLGHCRFLTIC